MGLRARAQIIQELQVDRVIPRFETVYARVAAGG
jgi:hypothetical protein